MLNKYGCNECGATTPFKGKLRTCPICGSDAVVDEGVIDHPSELQVNRAAKYADKGFDIEPSAASCNCNVNYSPCCWRAC